MPTITIENHGPLIVGTDYFGSEMARGGKAFLSPNAGAFRLLLPPGWENQIADMRTGKLCVVTRGPWVARGRVLAPDALELMLEDDSEDPWCAHLNAESCAAMPADDWVGRECVLTVWTRSRGGTKPHKALERPAVYRKAEKLPWLRQYTPSAVTPATEPKEQP